MSSRETEPQVPYLELEIPEIDLGWMTQAERFYSIMALLEEHGVQTETALFCGIEGETIKAAKTFGQRGKTWAVTKAEFEAATRKHDEFDQWNRNPLAYAVMHEQTKPALAVFDSALLDQPNDVFTQENEWVLRPNTTMDGATLAVIYLT